MMMNPSSPLPMPDARVSLFDEEGSGSRQYSSTGHKGLLTQEKLSQVMHEEGLTTHERGTASAVEGFSGLLTESLNKLNDVQEHANTQAEAYAVGDPHVTLHDVMSASTQAELSLQAALQVRNKLVSAYQDVMRMPL